MDSNNINNNINKNSFLVSCVFSVLILMSFCYFSINYTLKGTRAGFGGLTGCLVPTINVSYFSNFPDSTSNLDSVNELTCNQYVVSDNIFVIPSGYEFAGWDTNVDGSGSRYKLGDVIQLEEDLNLYAQWTFISDEELENNPDEDENVNDDNDDLKDDSDKDNTTDDDIEIDQDDNSQDNKDDSDKDNISSDENNNDNTTGDGKGENGSGNASTGNDKENNVGNNSNQGSNNNQSNSNKNDKDNSSNNDVVDKDNNSNIIEKKYYNFKFVYDDKDYSSSTCEVLTDGTCLMLLPGINPNKNGYTFTGWSANKDCPATEIITKSISASKSNTYYACFVKNANNNTGVNFMTVGITVFGIWVVALTLIYCLVKWFKKKESNN